MTDNLSEILELAGAGSGVLRRAELERLAGQVTRLPMDELIQAAVLAPNLSWDDGRSHPPDYLEIHNGHCWLDLREDGNREYLIQTIASAAVVEALDLPFGISWVVPVLPLAATVTMLAPARPGLLLTLHRRATTGLPADLADTVNAEDFADFVRAVVGAPEIVLLPVGGQVAFTGPR